VSTTRYSENSCGIAPESTKSEVASMRSMPSSAATAPTARSNSKEVAM
jgi:hypothetical protein